MIRQTTKRSAIAALVLSASAFVGLAMHENYREIAYMPTPDDVPTIGFGTTDGVRMGDTITPPRALARALADASKFEGAIKQCVTVPLHQHEYDALVSLAYNIGAQAFCGSTLVKKLNAGDYEGACIEIKRWNRQGGKILQGLVKRRETEYKQCMGTA
ncbi:lysozyme [Nitrosovibrio tenuis]|uniref:Lysozyme n=1 Tax=Nitrosovibrio tenuis TaxID=1233 RepID=A0A1H7IV36_9PROT|nr:lysozyme [Nitrosovibrio tenuis]SEK64645.1 lysozyme [Nitrosovibrio tenuis]